MLPTFVRADGCVQLGPDVTCDGFSPSAPVRIQSHVHQDHMKDFERSKGLQQYIVCTEATHGLLCAEFDADLPRRRRQLVVMPSDGVYRPVADSRVLVALFPAGHMIGSAICAIKYPDGAHYAYTSDFAWPLRNLPVRPNVLIVDATYGDPTRIRNYRLADVVNRFQQTILERRNQGSIVITGHRGRLQYALQLMADYCPGPFLVSKHVADTLAVYMHHQGFHVQAHNLSSEEARSLMRTGSFISLIETRDKTDLHSINADTRIFLSAFMVPREDPVLELSNGTIRIALTDHADFHGTIELIKAVEPACVVADSTRGGNGESLAEFVSSELGIPSTSNVAPTSPEWGCH